MLITYPMTSLLIYNTYAHSNLAESMSYKITRPVVLEFLLLGKARKMVNYIKESPALLPYLSAYDAKTIVFEFEDNEHKEKFIKNLMRSPYVQRKIRTKEMQIT